MTTKDDGNMRSFDTGATRDTVEGKLDYEGFLSPVVLKQYARFMNMNRLQSDGTLRDSDNWAKGIPTEVYMKSGFRHFFEWWSEHRNPQGDDRIQMMAGLCGLLFNVMGYMHEYLKIEEEVRFDADEPTDEMAQRLDQIDQQDREAETSIKYETVTFPNKQSALRAILQDAGKIDAMKVIINPDERDNESSCCSPDCGCNDDLNASYRRAFPHIYGFTGLDD